MDLYFLIFFSVVLLALAFSLFNKELTNPTFIFYAMFIIMFCFAFQYKDIWWEGSGINSKTILAIVLGGLSFFIGSMLAQKNILRKKYIKIKNIEFKKTGVIKSNKHFIWIIFQICVLVFDLKYVMSFGDRNITSALGNLRNNSVASGINMPIFLSFSNAMSFIGGMFYALLLAKLINKETTNKKEILLIVINYFISIIISLSGGNKGGGITLVVSLICDLLMINSNLKNWEKNLSLKYLLITIIIVVAVVSQFKNLAAFLGQTQVKKISVSNYLILYIGSQIKNLDIYFSTNPSRSVIFGQETLRSFIQLLSRIVGNNEWASYRLYVPMRYAGGMALGNVCTLYYAFFRDFGWMGIITMPIIMGYVSQKVYKASKKSLIDGEVSISLLLFGYVYYAVAFSYFSDIFFEQIICISMIKYILCAFIIRAFFYGVGLKYER